MAIYMTNSLSSDYATRGLINMDSIETQKKKKEEGTELEDTVVIIN